MPAVVESMSPNPLPAMDSTTPSSTAASDKKRNKLGYHRTSVACVHCRRRKIRCLVAADDAHGRCENCIRLRKECQFFPVDQQPPIEKKSRPNSRLESASTDPSTASSSPPIISGRPDQTPHQHQHPPHPQPEPFFTYQPIPLSASQDMSGLPSTASFAPENPMSPFAPDTMGAPEFAAPPSLDPSVPWDEFTTISDPHMLATMNAAKQPPMINLNPNVWNPDNPVPIPSNAPLQAPPTVPSQSQPQSLNTTPTPPTFAIQPDGSVWQVPPPPPHQQAQPQPQMAASYPPPPGQFAASSPMDLDPKRRMTSPNTHSFPGTPGTPVNPQSPPPADPMQTMSMSMSYPGQAPHPAMGFPVWPDASGMAAMNVLPYPMFAGDATTTTATASTSQQGTPFGSPPPPPPMGHPGPRHSPHG